MEQKNYANRHFQCNKLDITPRSPQIHSQSLATDRIHCLNWELTEIVTTARRSADAVGSSIAPGLACQALPGLCSTSSHLPLTCISCLLTIVF